MAGLDERRTRAECQRSVIGKNKFGLRLTWCNYKLLLRSTELGCVSFSRRSKLWLVHSPLCPPRIQTGMDPFLETNGQILDWCLCWTSMMTAYRHSLKQSLWGGNSCTSPARDWKTLWSHRSEWVLSLVSSFPSPTVERHKKVTRENQNIVWRMTRRRSPPPLLHSFIAFLHSFTQLSLTFSAEHKTWTKERFSCFLRGRRRTRAT